MPPTAEQLPLITNVRAGVKLIRGAAGSGKTSTAVLRLKQLSAGWLNRRTRLKIEDPVRILVVTFNRTLRGYISELVEQQVLGRSDIDLDVSTFGKWSKGLRPEFKLVDDHERSVVLDPMLAKLGDVEFLRDEVDYVLSRFEPNHIEDYITCARDGRGATPRVDKALRQRLLSDVIAPYASWKASRGVGDWNDLAISLIQDPAPVRYDIMIADEAQDLSANQVRALMAHVAKTSSVTFVLDAAQRIYPRGFTWKEAGITIQPADSHRLKTNHRNTVQICKFAQPLLEGMELGDDGTFPDFKSCKRTGRMPIVLVGKYASQMNYVLEYIEENVDLTEDSVAFLKPFGGGWFDALKAGLAAKSYAFVELTRQSEWPRSPANIALSTMNSAKGLEFDHVIILGLNAQVTRHGDETDDSSLSNLRRLLAMAITRARQ